MAEHINVFMSSTSRDLPEYRKTLFDIITGLDMFPIGMEHFHPTADNAMQVCYDAVQKAEIFFGLYAFRYGFVPPTNMTYTKADGTIATGDGITGVTEWEYRWAIERGIPILLFVVADNALWKQDDVEEGTGRERLKAFKNYVSSQHVVVFFKEDNEFQRKATSALNSTKYVAENKQLSATALRPQTKEAIVKAEQSALNLANTEHLKSQQEAKKQVKQVGILPKRFDDNSFHNREHQQAEINQHLLKGGLVSVYGQGGIGKTGLICKILGDIEKSDKQLDGRVFLRANSGSSITIDQIVDSFAKILPDAPLPTGQESNSLSHRQKSEALLEALQGGNYLLVIDNAESLQDENHKLQDPALETFLETVLETKGNDGVLTVLITGRVPIPFKANLKPREIIVRLDEGLPLEDARTFLRQLDAQKRLPEEIAPIDKLIERLRGFPHSLEAAVGWLSNNSTQNLEGLLAALPNDPELTEFLVEKAQDSLPEAFQKVIQAVAVVSIGIVEQAIPQALLEYLLAPYLDIQQVPALLNRLVQARFIIFNDINKTYSLHPYDREYALKVIPAGLSTDPWKPINPARYRKLGLPVPTDSDPMWTRHALNSRMAEFYSKQRLEKPQSLADLQPQLREFEHRFANADYDTACQILVQIDFDFLLLWGHADLIMELHSRLHGLITNPNLIQHSVCNLGLAHHRMGQAEKAIDYYETALAMARSQNNRQGEGAVLGNLGLAYANLGQIDKAIRYYEQQLVIVREIKDKRGEGGALGNLGNAYADLGQIDKAIRYYEQALAIHKEVKGKHGEGIALGNLGLAYADLGQIDKAIRYYEQQLVIVREIKDRYGEGNVLGSLGSAYADLGQIDKAIRYYEQQLVIAREIKDKRGEGHALGNLGNAYYSLGQIDKAVSFYEQQLVIAREIKDRRGESAALGSLGNAYYNLGQIDKAISYYEQNLVIAREIKDKAGQGVVIGNLGNLHTELGEYSKAIPYIQEALSIMEEIKSPNFKNYMGSFLAKAYLYSGEITEALNAIRIARHSDSPQNNHVAATLHGIVALTAKEDAEAKAAFVDALRFADELLAKTANLFEAIYYRAIAHLGALACGGDISHLEAAKADIARAKSIFAGEGTINQTKRLLEALSSAANQSWDIGL